MKNRLQAFWEHPLIVVACNIALVMVLYSILRLSCYYMDRSIFPDMDTQHLIEILLGGTRFDLTAILYLSSLYIIGSLLPFPAAWRENRVYQKVLLWLYWIPNAIGMIVDAADSVYIRFTDRRATCASFTELSNEDNIGIILANGIVEYWYVVLMGIAVPQDVSLGGGGGSHNDLPKKKDDEWNRYKPAFGMRPKGRVWHR